jgi:hypothetical protein
MKKMEKASFFFPQCSTDVIWGNIESGSFE